MGRQIRFFLCDATRSTIEDEATRRGGEKNRQYAIENLGGRPVE